MLTLDYYLFTIIYCKQFNNLIMAINTYTPKQKQEVNSILNQSDIPDSYWDRLADIIKESSDLCDYDSHNNDLKELLNI